MGARKACKTDSLLAAEPAGETTLCLFGVGLDRCLCVGSGITDLLVKGVDGAVKLFVGLLSVLVDVLLCVGTVGLELGVELARLLAGVLDLRIVSITDDRVRGVACDLRRRQSFDQSARRKPLPRS